MLTATVARLGLFIIASVHRSHGQTCADPGHFQFSADLWGPRAAYEGALAGEAQMTIPPVGRGFNRTLNIDGFCNDILMKSSVFTCSDKSKQTGEFSAFVSNQKTAPTGSFIRFDDANCPLSAITIRRTPGAKFEAEIRFQFEFCAAAAGAAASPVASAAVVMGLRKETGRRSNLLPWMKEVCHVKAPAPAAATVSQETKANLVPVGDGPCKVSDGGKATTVAIATSEMLCKSQCAGSIMAAKAGTEADKKAECTGFSFDPTAAVGSQCQLFTGGVTAIASVVVGAKCYGMTMTSVDNDKTVAALNPVDALEELTQNLHLREVMSGSMKSMSTAKLLQIQPQKGDDFCFPSSWWFQLQDDNGNEASIPVMEAEWDTFMAMIPQPKAANKAVRSTVIVDRVLVKTCNPEAEGWGRECLMPEVETVCDKKQMIMAVLTGILVPVLSWALVKCFAGALAKKLARRDIQQNYDLSDEQLEAESVPQCSVQGVLICCVVAVISCAAFAFGFSFIISLSFGAAGCLHGDREAIVVASAAGIPAAVAMIIGILYLNVSSKRHEDNKVTSGGTYAPPKGQKLMLLQVPLDASGADLMQGVPINPDILQTGTSAMASYSGQGHPGAITIDQTASMISSYQSPTATSQSPTATGR